LQENIRKDELTIDDFLKQLEAMEKMGPIKSLMKMLPGGLSEMAGDIDENQLKYAKAIIRSMTMQERENPELLNQSRRQRIAKGSARPVQEVNSIIKQFEEARKMIKMMKKGKGFPGMPGMGAPPPPGRRRCFRARSSPFPVSRTYCRTAVPGKNAPSAAVAKS